MVLRAALYCADGAVHGAIRISLLESYRSSPARPSGSSSMKIKIYKEEIWCDGSRVKGPTQGQINLRNIVLYNKRQSIHYMISLRKLQSLGKCHNEN